MIIHYNCTIGSFLLHSFLLIYHPYPPSFHEMIFTLVVYLIHMSSQDIMSYKDALLKSLDSDGELHCPPLLSGSGCCGEVVGWRHIPGEGGGEGEVRRVIVYVH